MSAEYKGLFLKLGVDGDALLKDFEQIDVKLRKTQQELNTLQRSLKLEFDADKFKKAQEVAQRAVEESNEKVKVLKETLKEADEQGVSRTSEDYKNLQKELEKSELAAQRAGLKLKEINNIQYDRITKDVKAFDDALNKVVITGTAAAAAITAAGVAVYKFSEFGANATDEIDKMSIRLGMSRQGYQELSFALSQYGIEITSMNTGMKTMTAAMASLSEEGKKGEETLGRLGVTVNDLKNKSQEEIFKTAITQLQNMEGGYEKARLAQMLFGKQGQEMLPLLNAQKGSLEELAQKANDYGLVLSDEIIDKGVALHDSIDLTKRKFEALKITLSSALFEGVNEKALDLADYLNTDEAQEKLKELGVKLTEVMELIIQFGKSAYDARGFIAGFAAILIVLKSAMAVTTAVIAFRKAMDGVTASTKAAQAAQVVFNATAMGNPYMAVAVALASLTAAIIGYNLATGNATSETKKLSDEMNKLSKDYDNLKSSVDSKVSSQLSELDNVERLSKELEELSKKENKTTEDKNRMKFAIDEINKIIPNSISLINSETMEFVAQGDAIDVLIGKMRALSILKGKQELYDEANKNIAGNDYNAGYFLSEIEKIDKKFEEGKLLNLEAVYLHEKKKGLQKSYDETQKLGLQYFTARDDYESTYAEYQAKYGNSDIKTDSPPPAPPPAGSSSSSSKTDNSAEKALREAEEQRKLQVKAYEDSIREYERLDERYRNTKKGYGELSVIDELSGIGEQAKRYREYANEVLTLEYLTNDEKLALHKQYTEKAEDLELAHFKFAENLRKKVIDDYNKKLEEAKKIAQEEYDNAQKLLEEYVKNRSSAIDKNLQKEKDAIKTTLDAELESISKRISAQKELLQAKIDAINEEIKARRELREDESIEEKITKIQKQIASTQAQISFARDEDTIRELQKQLVRQQEELSKTLTSKEDTFFYRAKQLEIDELQAQISGLSQSETAMIQQAREQAEAAERRAQSQATSQRLAAEQSAYNSATTLYKNYYDTSNATYNYNQQTGTVILQNASLSAAQIANVLNKITR